jgi:hypothetical protein
MGLEEARAALLVSFRKIGYDEVTDAVFPVCFMRVNNDRYREQLNAENVMSRYIIT